MASADLKKLHGSEAIKILGHDTRWDGRKDVDYRNTNINPNKTIYNGVLQFKGMNKAETSKQAYERLKRRVEEIDAKQPPRRIRKDRVTMVALECPVPNGLPPEQEKEFFAIVYREFARMCGGSKNVSRLYIHRDELHEYTDPVTKQQRMSRVHCHAVGIPYTKEKGINCKSWMTRGSLRTLQQTIHTKCKEELNIDFMDGSGAKSRATVEQLKMASLRAAEEQERQALQRVKEAKESIKSIQGKISLLEEQKRKIKQNIASLREDEKIYQDIIGNMVQDHNYLMMHRDIMEELQEYHPDEWKQIQDNLYWKGCYEKEDFQIEPSEPLREVIELQQTAQNMDLELEPEDYYPTYHKSRGHDDFER